MAPSALALDIDGTITTANDRVVWNLVQSARALGAHIAINTARPSLYCFEPDDETARLAAVEDHYCYTGKSWLFRNLVHNVPESKVQNMEKIQAKGKVARRECCFLVDDRRENVQAIDEAGYTGIHVDYRKGITRSHALDILARLTACAQEHGNSGLRPDAVVEGPNLPGPR